MSDSTTKTVLIIEVEANPFPMGSIPEHPWFGIGTVSGRISSTGPIGAGNGSKSIKPPLPAWLDPLVAIHGEDEVRRLIEVFYATFPETLRYRDDG